MKWVSVMGITLIVLVIFQFEWLKIKHLWKEKVSFSTIMVLGYILAVTLVFYPDLPGPTHVLEVIYEPFAKILE
ncbi:hypothetical protein [Paenibacillus sp. WC2504]|uniref:hypothetical protein n=1 Tax=Paenibacillus sp. WC2504 TaxID=3461403 RepID=UPI0040451A76